MSVFHDASLYMYMKFFVTVVELMLKSQTFLQYGFNITEVSGHRMSLYLWNSKSQHAIFDNVQFNMLFCCKYFYVCITYYHSVFKKSWCCKVCGFQSNVSFVKNSESCKLSFNLLFFWNIIFLFQLLFDNKSQECSQFKISYYRFSSFSAFLEFNLAVYNCCCDYVATCIFI